MSSIALAIGKTRGIRGFTDSKSYEAPHAG
jgi:hypothetical protein